MGTKELCELSTTMRFVIASPAQPAFIGVCIYKECTVPILNSLADSISQLIGVPVLFYDAELQQSIRDQQRPGFIGACVVLGLLLLICLVGVLTEYTTLFDRRGGGLIDPEKRKDRELVQSKSKLGLFFLAFSVTRNTRKIMSVAGGGGDGYDKNLEVFAGVRTFSMMYVILGHT